jgi:hypothetical protein
VYIYGLLNGKLGIYKNGEKYIDIETATTTPSVHMFFVGNDFGFTRNTALYKNNQKMYDFEKFEGAGFAPQTLFPVGNDVWASSIVDIGHVGHSLLWKNGQIYIEPTSEYQGIFVNKNDIYAYDHINGRIIKNGTVLYNNVFGNFFRFSGDNLYWLCDEGNGNVSVYKNGQVQYTLANISYTSVSMAVIGNDVYLLHTGSQNNGQTIAVWKNNKIAYTLLNTNDIELQEGEVRVDYLKSPFLSVANGSIYVAENFSTTKKVPSPYGGYNYVLSRNWATVWKDQQVIFEKEGTLIFEILAK